MLGTATVVDRRLRPFLLWCQTTKPTRRFWAVAPAGPPGSPALSERARAFSASFSPTTAGRCGAASPESSSCSFSRRRGRRATSAVHR